MKHEQLYSIHIYCITDEDDEPYYIAYLPDFGVTSCSGMGNTPEAALNTLKAVKRNVFDYYRDTGKSFPKPTLFEDRETK